MNTVAFLPKTEGGVEDHFRVLRLDELLVVIFRWVNKLVQKC